MALSRKSSLQVVVRCLYIALYDVSPHFDIVFDSEGHVTLMVSGYYLMYIRVQKINRKSAATFLP